MSTAPKVHTPAYPAPWRQHDLIRVQGARENNLKDVSVEIPKAPADGVHRRLGLRQELARVRHDRGRVAAADQRDLQRLCAGLHADPGAARRRRARRADDGDHRRPGAHGRRPRSTVGTATDANAHAAHPVQPARQAARRPTDAFSFNVPSVRATGAITVERGAGKTVRKTFTRAGGMCPRCEGLGRVSDIDLAQLYDDSKSLAEGAITSPARPSTAFRSATLHGVGLPGPGQADPQYTKKEMHDFLHREPTR